MCKEGRDVSWLAVRRQTSRLYAMSAHPVGCKAALGLPCFTLWDTCRAPRVIAALGGESVSGSPVSNPALCRVVGMREDGRTLRLFRGRRANFYSPPLGSPIWGFTAHVGGRTPSRVHNWVSPHFLSLWLFLSSLSACVLPWGFGIPVHCLAVYVCLCIHMKTLRLPRCVSTGPLAVRLAEMEIQRERERERVFI